MQAANFTCLLRNHAERSPDTPAVVAPASGKSNDSWNVATFAELDRRADAFANGFSARGLRSGDRALFLVKPSIDFYAALFGLLRLGAVPVLIDPGMGLRRVLHCVEEIRPSCVIAIPIVHAIRTLHPAPFRSASLHVTAGARWLWGGATLDECAVPHDSPFDLPATAASDDAIIAFTSGSTGPAKGVTFTHGMFTQQTELLARQYGWKPGDRMVMCFAAFVLFTVSAGMTTVIPAMDLSKPAKANPERIVEAANAHHADFVFGSPIIWMNLIRGTSARFDTVRQVITTGAPISLGLHRRMRDHVPPGTALHTPYGATEALPLTTISSDQVLDDTAELTLRGAGTCVGSPFPGVELRIIRVTDEPIARWSDDLPVPPGELGEIVACSDVVSPSYKENDRANAEAKILDGDRILHRMGDLGYLDDQGRLWFCGRKAHRLETERGIVPAVPVENIFNQDRDVFRSALVGIGERGNQVPVLCVEMNGSAKLTPSVMRKLAALAKGTQWDGLVQGYLQHPSFPVDPRHNSKINRELLRSWAAERWRPSADEVAA